MFIVIQSAKAVLSDAFIHHRQTSGPWRGAIALTFISLFDRDTAQTVKERFGKKLYESLLV